MISKQQKYLQQRRSQAREYLGGVCNNCGTDKDLQFDHVKASQKSFGIADAINRHMAWAFLVPELDKCQLLCHPCHLEKTKRNGDDGSVPHGGGSSGKKNCPCGPCKKRKAEYMQAYSRSHIRKRDRDRRENQGR